jgi:hypothetical protein
MSPYLQAILIIVLSLTGALGIPWLTLRLTMPGEEKAITNALRRCQP